MLMGSLFDINDGAVLPRNKVLPFTGKLVLKSGADTSETATALPKIGFGVWKGPDNRALPTELLDTNVGANVGVSRVEKDEPDWKELNRGKLNVTEGEGIRDRKSPDE